MRGAMLQLVYGDVLIVEENADSIRKELTFPKTLHLTIANGHTPFDIHNMYISKVFDTEIEDTQGEGTH